MQCNLALARHCPLLLFKLPLWARNTSQALVYRPTVDSRRSTVHSRRRRRHSINSAQLNSCKRQRENK